MKTKRQEIIIPTVIIGHAWGFTLVELIVVITILAILGAIGFVSLKGYSSSARDSSRVADMTQIAEGLDLLVAKWVLLPNPDGNTITLTASWTPISYQGYAGASVLWAAGLRGGGKDPLDGLNYTYLASATLDKWQILWYLETPLVLTPIIETAYAGNYDTRTIITRGSALGVLVGTGSNLNQPVQELYNASSFTGVDLVNTTSAYTVVLESGKSISGTGSMLFHSNPTASCKRILESGLSKGDGIYMLNPTGSVFSAYCDMSTEGGGWTKLMHANYNGFFNGSNWSSFNVNTPMNATLYSILDKRTLFRFGSKYTFRLQVGRDWSNTNDYRTQTGNKTIWSQDHDPFTQATNGSDYEYISGEQPPACGGFNGLHSVYQGYAMTSDADTNDNASCWGLQVVPTVIYINSSYKYYTLYFSGAPYDWQILWVK